MSIYKSFTIDSDSLSTQVVEIFDILQTPIMPHAYIAGSLVQWLVSKPITHWYPNDIDVWLLPSGEYFVKTALLNAGYKIKSENDVAYVFMARQFGELDVNLIKVHPAIETKWQSEMVIRVYDILDMFDLSCSRGALLSKDEVVADVDFAEKDAKILLINNAMRTMERVIKYSQRGYKFSRPELFKLYRAWDSCSNESRQKIYDEFKPRDDGDDGDDSDDSDDNNFYFDRFEEDDWFQGE